MRNEIPCLHPRWCLVVNQPLAKDSAFHVFLLKIVPMHSLFRSARQIPVWAFFLVAFSILVNAFYIDARLHIGIDGIGTKQFGNRCVVSHVVAGSTAEKAGIQTDDILVAIDSVFLDDEIHLSVLENYRAGDILEYVINRNGDVFRTTLRLESFWSQYPAFYFILYFIILVVSITSLFIIYKKPYDKSARLFFIYLVLFAISQNSRFLFINEAYATFANVSFILSFNLFGAFLLHFHLLFPTPSTIFEKAGRIIPVIYTISALSGAILSFFIIKRNYVFSEQNEMLFSLLSRWAISWMGILLTLALIVAVIQFVTLKDKLYRNQLRLVIIGSVFGLITPIVFSMNPEFFWRLERERHLLSLVEFTNAAGSYIMITFIAVAIFRYRIWEIETFIRRAVLYTITTALILLFYVFLINVLNLAAINLTPFLHFTTLAVALIIFLFLKDMIQYQVDRIFFREKYDAATVVGRFEEKLAGIYHENELIQAVRQSMNDIFHFEGFVFALKNEDNRYKIINHDDIQDLTHDQEFAISAETQNLIRKSSVFSLDEIRMLPGQISMEAGELMVPVLDGNEPFGFFILGRKKSEKSYSLQDIQVLSLLARRIAALFKTAALYKRDLDRQLMLERERTRIAEDMHDDVGASLTRISMMSQIAINNLESMERVKPVLGQISETSREVIDEMNQIIWALNPKNDSLDGLIAFIRRFAMELFEASTLKCVFDLPENIPHIGLSVEIRRNIYLVVREALHNVLKHSGAKEVRISLARQDSGFNLSISDDGTGFDPGRLKYKGNGMANMEKRMKNIGGGFRIRSIINEGTEIILSF